MYTVVVAVARAVLFLFFADFRPCCSPNTRLTLRFAWRAGIHCADCCVLRGRKSGRAEVAVDTHLFHNRRPRVRVYTLADTTHNPPNKFNYCDHIFATEGLVAKFAKIKTAQKFVVIRYSKTIIMLPIINQRILHRLIIDISINRPRPSFNLCRGDLRLPR